MKGIDSELKKPHFGLHFTLDGYRCSSGTLNNRKKVEKFLNLLVRRLRMRKLFGPKIIRAPGNGKKDPGGWSGFVVIQESHFSVHTFPKRKFVSIDIYSCRDFDWQKAAQLCKKFFGARALETNVIVRGRRYPQKNLL